MPALASPATWRQSPYRVQYWMYIWNHSTVYQALVAVPDRYPVTSLTCSSTLAGNPANVQPGMTVIFGSAPGLDDRGRTRVRGTISGSSLPIGRTSRGSGDGEINIESTTYATVLEQYLPWAKIPYIKKRGKSYKDEMAFVAAQAQPPIANAGCHVGDFVDPVANTLTVDFDAGDSAYVRSGASSLTYSWDFGSGATPSTSTSQTPTVVFDPGPPRYITLTVNDGTLTHTTRIIVYPAPRTGIYAPNQMDPSDIERTLTPEGQRLGFNLNDDMPTPPDGAVVFLFATERFGDHVGSLAGPSGRENVKFVGYHTATAEQSQGTVMGLERSTQYEALDVGLSLASLPAFPQIVLRKATPKKWEQMADANMDRYIHYLLYYHTTALEIAPFVGSGTGDGKPFKSLSSDGGSIYDQVDRVAKAIKHQLTCDSHGRLFVKADPQRLDSGARESAVQVALVGSDYSVISVNRTRKVPLHWLEGDGIIAGTGKPRPVFGIAPGKSPGQGRSAQKAQGMLVDDLDDLLSVLGHDYARANAVDSIFTVDLVHGGDAGIEPALMEWVTLTQTSDTAAYRGKTLSAQRMLPMQITYRHNAGTGGQRVRVQLEKESVGTPAHKVKPPNNTLPAYTPPQQVWQPPQVSVPVLPLPVKGTQNIAWLSNQSKNIVRTGDFDTPSYYGGPTWEYVSISGVPTNQEWHSWVTDPFSPRYLGTGTEVNGWLVLEDYIYRVTDIFGATPSGTLQHTFTYPVDYGPPGFLSARRHIQTERGLQNWVMCASFSGSSGGTTVAYTTDGSTWTEVQVSPHYNTNRLGGGFANTYQTLMMSGHNPGHAWVGAFTATGSDAAATAALFKTEDKGATWAQVAGMDTTINLGLYFHLPFHDNADDSVFYWTRQLLASNRDELYRTINGVSASINPLVSSGQYAGASNPISSIDSSPLDRRRLALVAYRWLGSVYGSRLMVSYDGGSNWIQRTSEPGASDRLKSVWCAGNDPNVLYLAGGGINSLLYSTDFGVNLDSRLGNLNQITSNQDFLGYIGG